MSRRPASGLWRPGRTGSEAGSAVAAGVGIGSATGSRWCSQTRSCSLLVWSDGSASRLTSCSLLPGLSSGLLVGRSSPSPQRSGEAVIGCSGCSFVTGVVISSISGGAPFVGEVVQFSFPFAGC